MISKKDYALNYFDNGLIPIPLCWADSQRCACFIKHKDPKQIGKAPLVKYKDITVTREIVEEWFTKFPQANIGILIKESDLVIVDADSKEAVEEFETVWTDASMIPTVITGRGKHYYFKTNPTTPIYRSTHNGKSGMIDIFSDGYIVAPPSVHSNGHLYEWENPPKKTGLPYIPKWMERFLTSEANQKTGEEESVKVEITDTSSRAILAQFPLNNFIKSIITQGENSPYYKERGYKSQSEALHAMIVACYKKGLTDDQIFSIFTNPRYALSYRSTVEKRSNRWLLGEMKRAKGKETARKKTKKNSRFDRTTTGVFPSIQANEIERISN